MRMMSHRLQLPFWFIFISCFVLCACGFRPQGEIALAKPLHKLYFQTNNPYGQLARNLKESLRLSHVILVDDASQAETILNITEDQPTQTLTSVSGSQQTRQYELKITVTFSITDNKARALVPPQSVAETRALTIQSNQILGSSNETSTYYSQMRRSLAYVIMNRLGSNDIAHALKTTIAAPQGKRHA